MASDAKTPAQHEEVALGRATRVAQTLAVLLPALLLGLLIPNVLTVWTIMGSAAGSLVAFVVSEYYCLFCLVLSCRGAPQHAESNFVLVREEKKTRGVEAGIIPATPSPTHVNVQLTFHRLHDLGFRGCGSLCLVAYCVLYYILRRVWGGGFASIYYLRTVYVLRFYLPW